MSLIIRKMVLRKKNRRAKYSDFPSDSLQYDGEGRDFEMYTYEPSSNPIDQNLTKKEDVYNGSVEEAPIDIEFRDGNEIVNDKKEIAKQIYEKYGPGRFNVFILGGYKRCDTVFVNTVIREKPGKNKNQSFKAEA